jgi:hypothetical protein
LAAGVSDRLWNGHWDGGARGMAMFSIPSCAALFALEVVYVLAFYDPSATRTQAGLMLIFALEAGYLVKIAQSNLEEKKLLGKISATTRLYTALAGVPLLGLMAIAGGLFPLKQYSWVLIALFFLSIVGKVIWRKNRSLAPYPDMTTTAKTDQNIQ